MTRLRLVLPKTRRAWAVVIATGLGVLLSLMALSLTMAPGRWIVAGFLEGRSAGSLGRIHVEGIHGNVLADFSIDRLTLSDEAGVWLVAEGLRGDWDSLSLIRKPLWIETVSARRVEVLRSPQMQSSTGARGDFGLPELDLDQASIDALALSGDVPGGPAVFSVRADTHLRGGGIESLSFHAWRVDGPGDEILVQANSSLEGAVQGQIEVLGAPDGPIASLLRLEGRSLDLRAQLDGGPRQGRGDFTLTADLEPLADGRLLWNSREWDVDSRVRLDRWTLAGAQLGEVLGEMAVRANGSVVDRQIEVARISGSGVDLDIHPDGDRRWRLDLSLDNAPVRALLGDRPGFDAAQAHGRLVLDPALEFVGEISIDGLTDELVSLARIEGPVRVQRDGAAYAVALDLEAEGVVAAEPRLDALIDDRLTVSTNLHYLDGVIDIEAARIQTPHLEATGRARYAGGQIGDLSVTARLDDAARVEPGYGGPVSVVVAASEFDLFDLQIDASSLTWPETFRGLANGLTVNGRVLRQNGGWAAEAVALNGLAVDLDVSGSFNPQTGWSARGEGAVSVAELDLPVATGGAVAINFDLAGGAPALTGEIGLATTEVRFGDSRVVNPLLNLQLRPVGGAAFAADWRFSGEMDERDIQLSGDAAQRGGRFDLTLAEGRLGTLLTRGTVGLENGTVEAGLHVEAYRSWAADLLYTGSLDAPYDGIAELEAALRPQIISGVRFSATELNLSGPLRAMTLEANVSGQYQRRFNLALPGQVEIDEAGVRASGLLTGQWGEIAIASRGPLTYDTQAAGFAGTLDIAGGELSLTYGQDALSVEINQLPARLVSQARNLPRIGGGLDGALVLRRGERGWEGGGQLNSDNLSVREGSGAPLIQLRSTFELDGVNRITARLGSDRMQALLNLEEVGGQLDGVVQAEGEIADLAGLFLPATAYLAGQMEADVRISGEVPDPDLSGEVTLTGGQLQSGSYGTSLQDITLTARMDRSELVLETLSLRDGRSGQASGSGRFTLVDGHYEGEARVDMSSMRLLALPDLEMTLSGETRLLADSRGWHVSGVSTIDRLQVTPVTRGGVNIVDVEVSEINLPDGRVVSARRGPVIFLDYRIEAEDGVLVSGPGYEAEWSIELALAGTTGKPRISGSATLIDGVAYLVGRPFELTSGSVLLDGPVQGAEVNLVARHQAPDITVEATISGTPADPTLEMTSDPSLPEDEILARLLFGEDASDLSAFEAAQLAAQLSGRSMLGLAGELRDLAGLDRLSVATNADGQISVTGGSRIGDDVYLEVETSGLTALATTRVEWTLTPDLSLLSRISDDTSAAVSLRWRRSYD